jgi:condensin-2 complex subunit H2
MYCRSNTFASDGATEGKSFEELCRAHIQAFAKGAEKYASETQLSKRVCDWQQRLEPILDDEEQRAEFDIHAYGRTVISLAESEIRRLNPTYSDKKLEKAPVNQVDFREVTRHRQQFEVCRMFLATLNLTNAGNVLVEKSDHGNSINIQLLNAAIESPMSTFLAPSVATENQPI